MCYAAASWSRLALLLGLAAIVVQALSLFTGSWLHTREVLTTDAEKADAAIEALKYGSVLVHARVGLLRTCVRVEKINATSYPYTGPHPSCFVLQNNLWQDVSSSDLGIHHGSVPGSAIVVTNVRQYTLVLGSVALGLMVAGELSALVSHFKPTNKLGVVLGCYLFLFAGLIVCLVVVTFSMMTDVPKRDIETRHLPRLFENLPPFTWELGTSYYLAVAAFALTHLVAALLVSAFMRRFSSLEAMVREVVPGADRKLREHQENNLVGLWEIYPSRAMRQLGCITLPGAMGCYGKLGNDGQASSGERAGKSKPDICSSNPESSADSLQQHLHQHLQADDAHVGEAGQDTQRPVSPYDANAAAGRSVSLGQPMSLTTSSQAAAAAAPGPAAAALTPPDALAGVSVPITVMRARPLAHPGVHQHRTIPCSAAEDAATALDTFPAYPDGTMTVARRKSGAAAPTGAAAAPAAFSTLDNRSRCGGARMHAHAHTHTLPHPPRQF